MNHVFKHTPNLNLSHSFSRDFTLVDRLLLIFDQMQVALNEKKLKQENMSRYQIILLTSTAKAMGTLLSISKLCDDGLVGDARSLLRKLLELSATLQYINQDQSVKDQRVNRFYHHGSIKLKLKLDDAQNDPEKYGKYINDGMLENRKEILTSYENAKSYFPLKNSKIDERYLRNWDGKSLTKIIRQSGMNNGMATFDLFSESVHFSSADIAIYIDFENSAVRTGIESEEIPFLLLQSLTYSCTVINTCNKEFNFNLESELQDFLSDLNTRNSDLVKSTGSAAF